MEELEQLEYELCVAWDTVDIICKSEGMTFEYYMDNLDTHPEFENEHVLQFHIDRAIELHEQLEDLMKH